MTVRLGHYFLPDPQDTRAPVINHGVVIGSPRFDPRSDHSFSSYNYK